MWLLEYVCSLIIKAKPGAAEYLPTGPQMHIQTATRGEKPACLVLLACMNVHGPSPVCSSKHEKKSWWQWQRPPLGKPGEGKQFISFKIECLSWTRWGSGSFVTDSGEYVYKQGQRKAGEMLFSLNFLLKMMTFTGKVFSFSGLRTTGSSSLPSHSFLHVIISYIISEMSAAEETFKKYCFMMDGNCDIMELDWRSMKYSNCISLEHQAEL